MRSHSSRMRSQHQVESSYNSFFEYVQGHKVKKQYAPLLRAIFHKHGDITRGSDVKLPNLLLERICNIFQRLTRISFLEITRAELQGMISDLQLFESQKIYVGWLLEWLRYVHETKIAYHNYLLFKEQEEKVDACIGCLEKDLKGCEGEISLVKEVVMQIAKDDEIKECVRDIKARVVALQTQPLVHSFL